METTIPSPALTENESMNDVIEINITLLASGTTTDIEVELKSQVADYSLGDMVLKIYLEKIGIELVKDCKKK
jgi:hypothetical protein